jgi:hypothetical protein
MSRLKLGSSLTLLASAMTLTMVSGCLEHPLKPVELEKGQEQEDQLQLTVNKDVDILFVIDNSGSMGEEQAILGANFPAFIDVLEAEDVKANYRIGVTTSDNGNQWCPPAQTNPTAGRLVLSSCRDRINDFLFGNDVDVRDLACNDICDETLDLTIQPTITDFDPDPKPRKWLENIEGAKNIPDATPMDEAFACFGPQGVNGCGFEAQLESMYLALTRAQTTDEESYGFLRASAILAIVHVTDEADCSHNKAYSSIFDADGGKTFWSDPDAAFPTSAVCWDAGVECEGDPSGYTACNAVNKDVDGNLNVPDSEAVLHPMSRYIGLVRGLEEEKQVLNASQEVIMALIGGVRSDGQVFYSDVDNTDPVFQNDFGIGPGCVSPVGGEAVPPVRLRDLVNEFSPGNMFSICDEDYRPALEAIANRIREQITPACYTKCVKDTDAATEIVDPECTVEEKLPGQSEDATRIQECARDANGYIIDPESNDYAMPADDVNVCYAALVDPGGLTPTPTDDMSEQCIDGNFNLEFKIARRPGFPAPGGTSISATCSLADFPEVSCPGIGG